MAQDLGYGGYILYRWSSMSEGGGVSLSACAVCVAAILLFQFLVSSGRPNGVPSSGLRRGDLHLRRRFQHLCTGSMIYAATSFFGRLAGASVLLSFALLFYGLHELRTRSDAVDVAYIKCFGSILRQHEISKAALPGAYYFLLGSGLSLVVFPLRVARLAILHLSVGDPAAAFFGTLYGRHKLVTLIGNLGGNKSLEGAIGCFCVTVLATLTVLILEQKFYFDMISEEGVVAVAWTVSLAAGISATAAELLDLGGWDDNLTLPLLSGVSLQLTVGYLL